MLATAVVVCLALPWLVLGSFELGDVVERATRLAAQQPDPPPIFQSGRREYLGVVAGMFEYFEQFQYPRGHREAGAIYDPVISREHQYSTPCFAHVGATLLQAGWYDDRPDERRAAVLAAVALAVDRSLSELAANQRQGCANAHCNFFSAPVALAISALETIVTPDVHTAWCAQLRTVDPNRSYDPNRAINWRLVGAAGEQIRLSLGLHHANTRGYIDSAFERTTTNWGPNGEFMDGSTCHHTCNPTAYDHFARFQVTMMLAYGLDTTGTDHLERTRGAAWVSMLMQSPWGELPTGSRSSQHQWNEAQMCAAFEYWAAEYAKQGDATSAKIFKRGAALALASVRRWIRPTGELSIVKNRFPISERHGYEGYSQHSQYNLLAGSMLCSAFHFANDAIREGASFAETGGFAFQSTALNKVFANAGGMYVEVETHPDGDRDTLGLTRVHTTAVDPRLSITAGARYKEDPRGVVGVGVVWDVAGQRVSKHAQASFGYKDVVATTTLDNERPAFSVQYTVPGARIRESYAVTPSEVRVETHLLPTATEAAKVSAFGLSFPAFVSDGESQATITMPGPMGDPEVQARAQVSMASSVYIPSRESCVWFEVLSAPPPACDQSKGWAWDLATTRSTSRNGFAKALRVKCEVASPSPGSSDLGVEFRIRPCSTVPAQSQEPLVADQGQPTEPPQESEQDQEQPQQSPEPEYSSGPQQEPQQDPEQDPEQEQEQGQEQEFMPQQQPGQHDRPEAQQLQEKWQCQHATMDELALAVSLGAIVGALSVFTLMSFVGSPGPAFSRVATGPEMNQQ